MTTADDISALDKEITRLAFLVDERRYQEVLDAAEVLLTKHELDTTQRYYVQTNCGAAFRGLEDYDSAIEAYLVALAYRGESAHAAACVAVCYTELGNIREAMNYYNRAVAMGTTDPIDHYNRACMAARLGEHAEMLVSLRKAIELDEQNRADAAADADFAGVLAMPEVRELLRLS